MKRITVDIRAHNDTEGLYVFNFIESDTRKILTSMEMGIELLQTIHNVTGNALSIIRQQDEYKRVGNN